MARLIAIAETHFPDETVAVLRHLVVTGCALALILAGQPFPTLG